MEVVQNPYFFIDEMTIKSRFLQEFGQDQH